MAKLVREKFTNCVRSADITDAHLNAGYAARLTTGGDMENAKPGVALAGSAADTDEIYGEIKHAMDANTVSVQTSGMMRFRSAASVGNINGTIGRGLQTIGTGASLGLVHSTAAAGVGFGHVIGGEREDSTNYFVVDAKGK